ncbi:MAG: hypothetical protein V4683_02925 [Bacteroidota bacterium]
MVIINACENRNNKIDLIWKNKRATGIQIPKHLLKEFTTTTPDQALKIVLQSGSNQSILGDFISDNTSIIFEPLIPLTSGLNYNILEDDKLIGKITVPFDDQEPAPELISVFPQKDTLPENTLKFYLQFSKPMRTGQSLQYISLLGKKNDTLHNVFLNLQPELWDTTNTVLTLWLDPGRIKRDLVLNKQMGNPLKINEKYQLVVSEKWKDSRGLKLSKGYSKMFFVEKRDDEVPDISQWQLHLPMVGTFKPLTIDTRQALDHYLLQESIAIVDKSGKPVKGKIIVSAHDQQWSFTPSEVWKSQNYKLQVNARLEDLSGNNLNRVFDRDITKEKKTDNAFYERSFEIKP